MTKDMSRNLLDSRTRRVPHTSNQRHLDDNSLKKEYVFELSGFPAAIIGLIFAIFILVIGAILMVLGAVTVTLFLWATLGVVVALSATAVVRYLFSSSSRKSKYDETS